MRIDFLPQYLHLVAVLRGKLRFSILLYSPDLRFSRLMGRSYHSQKVTRLLQLWQALSAGWATGNHPLRHVVISLTVWAVLTLKVCAPGLVRLINLVSTSPGPNSKKVVTPLAIMFSTLCCHLME